MKFVKLCSENDKKAILLILPQPQDLLSARKGQCSYKNIFNSFSEFLQIIDMTEYFLTENIEQLYKRGVLGAHLSDYGNRLLAEYLKNNVLKKLRA